MDEAEQALAYARADFSEPNQQFIGLIEGLLPDGLQGRLLDLGCGPADIPITLAERHAAIRIDALDGADAMLALAEKNISATRSAGDRIRLLQDHLPSKRLPHAAYDLIISNSLLHHLRDPRVLWQTVHHCAAPDAHIVVMDLLRPASSDAAESLAETYASDAPAVLRRDFHNSLLAAYTLEEVETQLLEANFGRLTVNQVSDRHLAVIGRL